MRTLLVALTFITSMLCTEMVFSNACLLDRSEFFAISMYRRYDTDHFWNRSGDRRASHNDFSRGQFINYFAFGINKTNTLTARVAWTRIEESVNGRTFGFEDLELGWKRFLCQRGKHTFALKGLAIIPFETNFKPPLKYGRYGGEIALHHTTPFTLCERTGCFHSKLGYRMYQGFPSDQVRGYFALDYPICQWLRIFSCTSLDFGIFNGHHQMNESYIAYHPNYRLLKTDLVAIIPVYRCFSLTFGGFRHLWGRNVGTSGGWYGGAQAQF